MSFKNYISKFFYKIDAKGNKKRRTENGQRRTVNVICLIKKTKLLRICIENHKRKTPKVMISITLGVLAEKEGFEPPDLLQSTVFKTAAFDRSAISPVCRFH